LLPAKYLGGKAMQDTLDFLKVIADETRLKIILMLSKQDMCVCEIMERLAMSQPAISHHLRILKKNNLVLDDKDGRWVYYSLNKQVFTQQLAVINNGLFQQIAGNLESRKTERNYGTCLRIENEMLLFNKKVN